MPGEVSGAQLFDWVRENRPEFEKCFVFVTGDALREDPVLERSGAPCLFKPFTIEEYRSTVEETLHALSR